MAATTFDSATKASGDSLSLGDLKLTGGTSGTVGFVKSTTSKSAGKLYWEVTNAVAGSRGIGICTSATVNSGNFCAGQFAGGYDYYASSGNKYNNGSLTAYGNSYTDVDVVGVALDLDNGKLFFSKNGTWQNSGDPAAGTGAAFTGLSGTFFAEVGHDAYSAVEMTANFGASAFTYTLPSGFVAWDTILTGWLVQPSGLVVPRRAMASY